MDFFNHIVGKLNTGTAPTNSTAPSGATSPSLNTGGDSGSGFPAPAPSGGSVSTPRPSRVGAILTAAPITTRPSLAGNVFTPSSTVITKSAETTPVYGGYGGWSDETTEEAVAETEVVDAEAVRKAKIARFLFWTLLGFIILGGMGVFDKKKKIIK